MVTATPRDCFQQFFNLVNNFQLVFLNINLFTDIQVVRLVWQPLVTLKLGELKGRCIGSRSIHATNIKTSLFAMFNLHFRTSNSYSDIEVVVLAWQPLVNLQLSELKGRCDRR